jgi:predicted nucleic acid-binding protein
MKLQNEISGKVLFDTNIIMDLLRDNETHAKPAALLFKLVVENKIRAFLAYDSILTIYYLYCKVYRSNLRKDIPSPKEVVCQLLTYFEILSLDANQFYEAFDQGIDDYEDAVKYLAAKKAKCDFLVTRDEALLNYKKKRKDKTHIIEPKQLLAMYQAAVAH